MSKERKQSTEAAVREIRRSTRRKFSPEEKSTSYSRVFVATYTPRSVASQAASRWYSSEKFLLLAMILLRSQYRPFWMCPRNQVSTCSDPLQDRWPRFRGSSVGESICGSRQKVR